VLALLLGIVMAVDAPSYAAIGAELVPEDDLGNAIALSSVINGLGRIIGMSIAGALVATGGPGLIFVLNAMTYLAVIAVLHRLPEAATRTIHRSAPGDDGLLGGLRFVARTPVIIACASLAFVVAAFGRNFQVTMAAMSESVFHTGARGYGALSVVFAVGALVGGLVAARCSRYAVSIVVSVALTASALQFVSAAVPSFTTFAAVLFPIAIAAVVFDSIALATVQIAAGDAHRGRVVALFASAVMLGTTVGAPLLGWLADTQGGRTSLAVGGVVVFGAATVVGITHERLHVPWRLRTS
jgi:MFS family permease